MITCIIIDDEQPARELIQRHLSSLTNFSLLASFENAVDAFQFLQKNKTDLIFLDIQMPRVSGLSFIKLLQVVPSIILTTAYREYAAEAFELDVFDYLVKPVTVERFMKSISKFNHHHNSTTIKPHNTDDFANAYFFFKTGREQTKIFLRDILYFEGLRDYVKVHTPTKTFVASERLSYIEEKLPENKFSRIHKSFIIALDQITHYTTEQVSIGNLSLPIGRMFKNKFFEKL